MIRLEDIEMQLNESDEYLARGDTEQAKTSYKFALRLLAMHVDQIRLATGVGAPIVGITAAELIDAVFGGLDHPLFNLIIGIILGRTGGKQVAQIMEGNLDQLWLRAYNGMGDACRADGDLEEARKYYESALKISPGDPIARQKLAEVT